MRLLELFHRSGKAITEGGNLELPGGHQAQDIDLKVTNRSYIVPILDDLLSNINSSFSKKYKKPLWNPKLLQSKEFLSGSSLHFFNVKGIPDETFIEKKPKVGDIDTQVNVEYATDVEAFLKSMQNQKIGPATLLGFKSGNEQFSSMWELSEPPIKIQIDLEFVKYDKDEPTAWSKFSHSSSWEDLNAGIKGVFHKFLIQALTSLTKQDFLLRKMVGRGKARTEQDVPATDNMLSFAVSSKEGGGLRDKYEPVLDAAGKPLIKDGMPVMTARPPADYNQDLGSIFGKLFGDRVSSKEAKTLEPKFWSFVGILEIMNTALDDKEKNDVLDYFINKMFGPGAQGLYKNDPDRDEKEKSAALNKIIEVLKIQPPSNIEDLKKTYRASYKVTGESINEADDANVVQSKRKGIVHLEKMKDIDFLNLLDEIKDEATGQFKLDNMPMTVKVDGFGARFGKDSNGRPYMETSRSGPKFEPGAFSQNAEKRQADPEVKARAKLFDDLYDEMMNVISQVDGKLGEKALVDAKVHCEVLYLPFATEQEDGRLKFVGISYDKLPQGVTLALVPLFVEKSSTGDQHPNSDKFVSALRKIGRVGSTMFIDNSLTSDGGLDVTTSLPPLENIEVLKGMVTSGKRDLKKDASAALQPVKDELARFIISNPNIIGKDKLGKDYEGIILNTKNGPVKITSQEQKDIITAKNAAIKAAKPPAPAGQEKSGKTAVVTAGSFVGHVGHQQLVEFVLNKAQQVGGDPYVYISSSVGADDPIPPDLKLQTWQKLYPGNKDMFQLIQEGGSVAKKIEKELVTASNPPPYDHIVVMVGEDRYAGFKKWMDHLGKRMKNPQYPGFDHVTFDVENTPRSAEAGGTGVSFTQLRNILKDPNATEEQQLALWMKGFDGKKLGEAWIKKLMSAAKEGMGVTEDWFGGYKSTGKWFLKKDGDVIRTVNGEPFTFKNKEDAVAWAMKTYKVSYNKQRIIPTTNPDKNLITTEAPIEMDPADPMDPMIHSHDKANPAKLKYRMLRAAGQLKDLAARATNASPSEWQIMAKQFEELKMNMEQIRHALEELGKIKKKGGIRSRGIDKFLDSIEEGYGRYWCSTDKKWKTRKGPKQKRSS
jgi:hypothetical protein